MRALKFLVAAARRSSSSLVGVLCRRAYARPARGALAAHRQARARVRARAAARLRQDARPADMKGKVWLLNVWASWCVSCRVEHPLLVELAKANVVPIVGLNYKDRRRRGAAVARAARRSVHALGRRRRRPRRHRLRRLRRARDLRRSTRPGVIRYKQIGPITAEALEQTILPLMREAASAHEDPLRRALRSRSPALASRQAAERSPHPTPRSSSA